MNNGSKSRRSPAQRPKARLQKKKPSSTARRNPSRTARVSTAPVAITSVQRTGQPIISTSGNSCRIRHKEYFSDAASTATSFVTTSYPIQPGVPTTFPWLSSIAQRYESYRFNSLCFEYETMAATTQVGTVMMAVDYDPLDPVPTSKSDLLSYKDASRSAPWRQFQVHCSPVDLNKLPQRYTRAGAISSSDLKTYDVGNLFVCFQGVAAATVGELYVTYDITLFTPQVADPLGGRSLFIGESTTAYFGTGMESIGIVPWEWTDGSTLTFLQDFQGLVFVKYTGTVMSADFDLKGTGTATVASDLTNIVNAGATIACGAFRVSAVRGQTLIPTLTETSLTGLIFYVAPCPYANLNPS